jgi:hypothetical protein
LGDGKGDDDVARARGARRYLVKCMVDRVSCGGGVGIMRWKMADLNRSYDIND